jgi:hypothetical protein
MSAAEAARVAQLREQQARTDRTAAPTPKLYDEGPQHAAGHVLVVASGGYMVQSKTTPGTWYLVHGASCSCPAGQKGTRCWHRSQVQQFVAALDRAKRRPVAPPNVSAMCD